MPPETRILITGGTGFIGRPLGAALAARGFAVHRTSRSARRWPGSTWHRFDLLRDDPDRLLEEARPDVIIHAAWIAPPASYRDHPDNDAFAEATARLATRAETAGATRQILIGSSVDGTEDDSAYARAKTRLRQSIVESLTGSWAWARPFVIYGPGEASGRLIGSVARAVCDGRTARIGPGLEVRDFIHIDDVVHALARLVDAPFEGSIDLGTGRALRVADVARQIAARAGRPDQVEVGALPGRGAEVPRLVADTRGLRRIGALPRIPLELGLDEAISLHRRRLEHAA